MLPFVFRSKIPQLERKVTCGEVLGKISRRNNSFSHVHVFPFSDLPHIHGVLLYPQYPFPFSDPAMQKWFGKIDSP